MAVARKTDPGTSHAAAADVSRRVTTVRSRVAAIFAVAEEPMTQDQLIGAYKRNSMRLGWPPASDSSIRTRCNELWRDGEVERVEGEAGKSRHGRAALLWRAVSVQNKKTGADKAETA